MASPIVCMLPFRMELNQIEAVAESQIEVEAMCPQSQSHTRNPEVFPKALIMMRFKPWSAIFVAVDDLGLRG